jgi:hypothetical protein
MTQETPNPSDTVPQQNQPPAIIDATPNAEEQHKASEDQTIEAMKEIQESAGQISELSAEEASLVTEFFASLLKILRPFCKTLEIPVSSLPEKYHGQMSKAFLYPTGQLILVHENGEAEILNLSEKENRDVLVSITHDIMAQLKSMINAYRTRTEQRVKFLMPITKELQKIAEVFSEK